ncbi:MAG: ABC transporter substrate-binding protein [Victivallaceae bacterium]|nr:ABC transporter substrate-binding protein [Victivallaceae bacterium]
MKRVFAVFTAICLLSGCACFEEEEEDHVDRPVLLAAIGPFSHNLENDGKAMARGMQIAVDELNSKRGINNRQVNMVTIDSFSDNPVETAARMGADCIVSDCTSSQIGKIVEDVEKFKIPLVISSATKDSYVAANHYVFRNIFTNAQQSETLAAYLWYWRQQMRICFLVEMDMPSEYERLLARQVADEFKALGGQVSCVAEYTGDEFDQPIKDLLTYNPNCIVVTTQRERLAKIIKRLRSFGYTGLICGGDAWAHDDFFNAIADCKHAGDCVFVSPFSDENDSEEYLRFRKKYMDQYGFEPDRKATLAHDAVKLLAIGLSDGTGDIRKFRKNWLTIRNHIDAGGVYTMQKDGNVDSTMYISRLSMDKNPFPTAKLLKKFQYSILKTYRNDDIESQTTDTDD